MKSDVNHFFYLFPPREFDKRSQNHRMKINKQVVFFFSFPFFTLLVDVVIRTAKFLVMNVHFYY